MWRVTSRVAIIIRSIACVFLCGFLRGDEEEEEEEEKEERMRSYTSWGVDQLEGGYLSIPSRCAYTRMEKGET